MEVINKIKDPKITTKLLNKIQKNTTDITIMEVCGTHTNAILKLGIKDLLPKNIKLINGPGCPVCVTPQGYIDTAITLSKMNDVIITTFGDLMRVPGTKSTLNTEKALGHDIRVVYSPVDSIKIAKENPKKKIVFLSIGFETTAPIIALTITLAKKQSINNFFILNSLKTMPEAMKSLVLNPQVKIDAFLCPGHVATIIGEEPFINLSKEYNTPLVICGFEANDILASILKLIEMKENSCSTLENFYGRLVKKEGNIEALKMLYEVFESTESIWRGIGKIDNAGLKLKDKYINFDILTNLNMNIIETKDNKGCSCGEILMGIKEPIQCKLFGSTCTPLNPIGPCMVSEEGACASFYKYR
ncbi:hydrogenase formation protein HypD [Clostridium celatum]|uniref:hydrogenase formation protein HypD n=1 Tax=Clostridium celatum TaxID=36834 RepID=UPI00319DF00D